MLSSLKIVLDLCMTLIPYIEDPAIFVHIISTLIEYLKQNDDKKGEKG